MKMSEKICFMILTGISIFLIGIFDARAEEFIRTQNVTYTSDTQINLNMNGGTQYKGIKFSNTFNTGDANIIVIPASLYIQYYDPATSTGGILVGITGQEFVSIQVYVNNYLCQMQSNGFKCIVPKNTNIQGEISIWFVNSMGASWQFNLIGKVDNNWQLYKDTSSSASEIENKMKEDIDNESKTKPNQEEYDKAQQKENTIIEGISDASPDNITFTQDINATGTIWNLIDNIVNTNAKIIGLIISILSIGLIKLILAR